ncbi:hypothetical protein ERO13_A05G238800v2 [Gossypium hirsutum]|nr:hypothetical protein ERO13_A05G238800v2 [Gossypium hirsutum]
MGVEEGTINSEGAEIGEEIKCFKIEPVNNGFGSEFANDSGDGSSGASESLRTYKRRRQLRSSSNTEVQDGGKASIDQVTLPFTDHCASLNDSNYRLQRKWRNVVLENMHQFLSGDEGGIRRCIQDALVFHQENDCNVTVKDSDTCHEDKQNCSPQAGQIPNGNQHTAEELEGVISNGSYKELNPKTTTESLINSRMKEGEYEQSPMLFTSDIQEVWRKLQGLGSEIISLAKSLSNITSASCSEQVGCSVGSAEKEKHEFCTRESETLAKPEQIEACGVFKVCTCRYCGEKADGKDCFVCDSCEEMYHVACIEPAVKMIPRKSWYCASCTSNGMGSPHENCVICNRLNAPRTLNSNVADENYNEHFETFTELEENSNCSVGNRLQLSLGSKTRHVCKICGGNFVKGEKLRSCEHPYCPNKYYHVRCLTMKQLKTYCSRWYCPSCLCRACLADKDDDKIVLCDGCDAAYHIYCMKPPRTSIPSGKWFCRKCDAGIQRIQRAKRAYESKLKMKGIGGKMAYGNLELSRNQGEKEESDRSRGGMDMLLSAASTLHFEEKLNATRKKS